MKVLFVLLALATAPLAASSLQAATVLDREFNFAPERFSLATRGGEADIRMAGATRELLPGRPDLPQLSEAIELPEGMRVASLEVVGADRQTWNASVRVLPTLRIQPNLGPAERTQPDPLIYGRAGLWPERVAELGSQGSQRGRNVAYVRLYPVRWDARSGRLERLNRVRVRLHLEPHRDPGVVVRERIVPEWEEGTAAATSLGGGRQAQPFTATQIPSVLGSPVAYLIITADALAGEFQRLADWKTQSGVPAVVRTMSFVRQQYPGAVDDAERVRMLIRDAYSRWGTKWVLLGGDTEVIPTRQAYTTFYSGEYIACDMYFSCVDGNWNADGDSLFGEGFRSLADPGDDCDILPDVYVGRAPVLDVDDVQRFVDKTLQYTKTPAGDYENNVLFFSEVLFPQDWRFGDPTPSLDGAELTEQVLPSVAAKPAMRYGRLYQNYTDPRWVPGAIEEKRARVVDSLNVGYNVAVHIGHGFRNVMSVGDGNLEMGDALGLTNGNRLTNLYAINCTSNAIDFPCIGEAYMHAELGGAVTNIGSTRFDFPTAGRYYQEEYFRLVFQQDVTAVGEAQAKQKLPFVPFSNYDGVNRWTEMTLLLLGDPELRIWTQRPRILTVTHASSMPLSDTTFAVLVQAGGSPLAGARVTAYKTGEDYRTGLTDGSGNVTLDFRPGSTGAFTLTVTGFNCRPYQTNVTVDPAAGARLSAQAMTIDDDATGGTSGNGDGAWDAGEVVDLTIPVRNNGGTTATGVTGKLTTPDALVTVVTPNVSYGSVAASATANGSGAYRVSIPFTAPDQREIPLVLRWVSGTQSWADTLQATLRAPEPRHFSHGVSDIGNLDGRPDPGEVVNYFVRLRNMGTGVARGVTAVLRAMDGLSTVTDSTATFGDIAPLAEVQGDAFVFTITDTLARFQLRVSTTPGLIYTQDVDVRWPRQVTSMTGRGSGTSIELGWRRRPESDLTGYNVYRSTQQTGSYTRLNLVPIPREAYYSDTGLSPLTQYFYKVAPVDSSGNEGTASDACAVSTNPPNHVFWPHETQQRALSAAAVDFVYQATQMDIAVASDAVYLWHADGNAPVDADGTSATVGDFSLRGASPLGTGFRSGPSFGDVDGGGMDVIAAAWDSASVLVFNLDGSLKPGFPLYLSGANLDQRRVWSGVALGDLDADGIKEMVFASNGYNLYVMRGNGQEWMDGDANPATRGVFKTLPQPFNYGTPALADLDGNGQLDIIYASYDGNVYAWRPNGTNLTGFPMALPLSVGITSSAAVGFLDGPGDTAPEIVVTSPSDSMYVITNTGQRKAGWPVYSRGQGGADMQTSPALADINNDGFLDVVHATSDGFIQVYNRNGTLQPLFNSVRYSTAASPASASSPVVADITGDGIADIIMGDNNATLTAFSGATGQVLAGFPILLPAEVYGTPALCDCDQDGLTEIVLADADGTIFHWDYDFPFSPNGPPPWPQFHHDARRTGYASATPFVDAPPPAGESVPRTLELASPWPNPTGTRTRVAYAVPADQIGAPLEITVHDVMGRTVRTLERGAARVGRHSVDWDLHDNSGATVGAGIYFVSMRLGTAARSHKLVILP